MAKATTKVPSGRRGPRMTGEERRASILESAMRVFAKGSYASATTSAIAREAGITEPVLYHHFKGKADLYSACLDATWDDLRGRWDAIIEAEPDATRWLGRVAEAGFAALDDERDAARLWLHAITDLAEDPKARPRVIAFTTDLHEYVADLLTRAQAAGGIGADLDPRAEAWIFLSIGILRALSRRLDGVADADFPSVIAARQSWYAQTMGARA
ncbi:MAG: TetR/AcrR family transcriptional regulator [Thermoleophilia bacterium]|nr:TetR/AcrR family transcriptional regulator [Thermoleophilia bacterium]